MNIVDKTGVPVKNPGDGLSHKDINAINNTVNNVVDAINYYLKNDCNVNVECGDLNRTFTLSQAVIYVPTARRQSGLKVRYLSTDGIYVEFVYKGPSTEEADWTNTANWKQAINIIDGGTW